MVIMNDCRRQRSTTAETSQLLLVVSDGRGLFLEGMDTVAKAVRQAREANIFLVFIVIDNPDNKVRMSDIYILTNGTSHLNQWRMKSHKMKNVY